ncbi:hypothetical protein EsDP_00007334 [Epichloe bromicola]|uniref:Prolyl 4-hydroxylase alpha subunit domain-containing protein n=1 Tax=Epichloe bromicola TaxID=79588 RepID=A0ABQ0D082_9HYPO
MAELKSVRRFIAFITFLVVPLVSYQTAIYKVLGRLQRSWTLFRVREPNYQVQVFKADPVVLYIHNFLSKDEIRYIVNLVKERYEVSRVWPDDIGYVDPEVRVSESAEIPVDDVVIRRIQKRARHFMGWRNANTTIQPIKTQRYGFNGFYTFHYDWVDFDSRFPGNRMTTFMVYVEDACTGGGTNFPRIPQPQDKRWCDVIACSGDDDFEDYPGVTFKPIAGSAIYWENFDANGNGHEATRHAALPVRSGQKTGLNVWSWDSSWRDPKSEHDQSE